MTPHEDCIYKEVFKDIKANMETTISNLKKTVQWAVGIMFFVVIGVAVNMAQNSVRITKVEEVAVNINKDYTPLFVVEGIQGSNMKLIEVLQAIPDSKKDNPRYLEAIRERNEFQAQILKQIALTRRGSK